jgi:hypothetical protein
MRAVYQRADIRAANLAAATINREVNNPSLRSGGELCMRLCFVHARARPFACGGAGNKFTNIVA